jgi:RNA polymerase sigma factor (sigma-70 family)
VVGATSEEGPSDAALLARFAAGRDESAFAALVERHGPMVLTVCRRVLRDRHEAEDAFQAVFLVLARKAGSYGWHDSIAGWLYTVAGRIACKARTLAARRARPMELSEEPQQPAPVAEAWPDVKPVLDEEMRRLPEKYRVPLVLCYLEGKTSEEAARLLGRPVGTVWSQLSRGREMLRSRLLRRGVAVPTAALATVLADSAAPAALPPTLSLAAVRNALGSVAAKDLVPAAVLAKGALREMFLTKVKWIVAFLVVMTAGGLAAAVLYPKERPAAPDKAEGDKANRGERVRPPDPAAKERLKTVTPELRDLVKSNSDFALDMYARLAAESEGKNLFFSPYSLSSALTMVAEGARGETADQMGKVLHYPKATRRQGDDAAKLPFEMGRVHTGMAALNDHFSSGNRAAPKEVRDKLAALRKELKAVNQKALDLAKGFNFDEQQVAATKSQKLAAEINQLQTKYDQYELRIANALWGEKTYEFKKSYFEALNKHYQTGAFFPVDFRHDFEGARKRINGWVEDQTHDKIKDMIPADVMDEMAKKLVRLILTNAIYFKGEWAEVFREADTKDEDFVLAGGSKVRVPMMRHGDMKAARYAAFKGDGTFFDTPAQVPVGEVDKKKVYPDERGFQLLELPYKGDEVSMLVIVPRSADGLAALEKKLTSADLQTWVGKLQKRTVIVNLPKFKLETKYAMEKTLQDMGMTRAFKDPRLADGAQFDGMSESEDPEQKLYITKVLHKAFVEVNEKGTEAAAATAVIMAQPTSAPVLVPFTPTFRADRPFLFLIRDVKTGSVLFLGRMTNPKQN